MLMNKMEKIYIEGNLILQRMNQSDFRVELRQETHHIQIENGSLYTIEHIPAVEFAEFRKNETYIKVKKRTKNKL